MTPSITKKTLAPQPVLLMRRQINPSEIAQAFGDIFGRVSGYAKQNGIALAGPPFARYLEMKPDLWSIEAGMPIAPGSHGPGGEVLIETLPGGLVATATHMGPYDKLIETHSAVQQWVKAEGLKIAGPAMESYITDPGSLPDPKDWKTEVFLPISE